MKYDILSVKEACECLYILEHNPCRIDFFIELFCKKYDVSRRLESVKIRGMLRLLERQGIVEIRDDCLYFHNTLTSNLRLKIIG